MKIAIITPSRNSEKYIENNLKSVHLLQNGDFSIEQIIVDGNSTDKTIEIIEAFKKEHNANIKIIQGKDKNMYDAINKGLKAMNGDIWACLNTDDLYYSGIVNIVAKEFNKSPDVDVVYGYPDIIDENGKFIHTLYLPKFNLDFLILRGYCLTILQPASFLRRRVVEKIGYFDINYNYASDYDYFIRVGAECKMKMVHKSFTQFREHPYSITCNKDTSPIQLDETIEVSKKYINKFGINHRSLFFANLKFYLIQMKIKNIKYVLKNIYELTKSNSWSRFFEDVNGS